MLGQLFHSPKIMQVASEEAGYEIFPFLGRLSPTLAGRMSPSGDPRVEGPGDREGRERKGVGRGQDKWGRLR